MHATRIPQCVMRNAQCAMRTLRVNRAFGSCRSDGFAVRLHGLCHVLTMEHCYKHQYSLVKIRSMYTHNLTNQRAATSETHYSSDFESYLSAISSFLSNFHCFVGWICFLHSLALTLESIDDIQLIWWSDFALYRTSLGDREDPGWYNPNCSDRTTGDC